MDAWYFDFEEDDVSFHEDVSDVWITDKYDQIIIDMIDELIARR